MAETTGISWCDSTWNPWRGCTKVSEGCQHCYAETLSGRNPGTLGVWGPNGTRVVAAVSYWNQPVKWAKATGGRRHLVFCASLADVFEDWSGPMVDTAGRALYFHPADALVWLPTRRPGDTPLTMSHVRGRVWLTTQITPQLTYLVLTKRPENILRMVPPPWLEPGGWPANVWPGTTTENQARADERIPELIKVPAAVKWLSVEPQIGPVSLEPWTCRWFDGRGISWVITGGESGHGARPFALEWARSLRDQCRAAGIAFFHKQHGDHPTEAGSLIRLGRAGKDPADWSADLRVQQFPDSGRRRGPRGEG